MGVRAVRIGWGSTLAAAQDALPGLDLNADGSRGAGDGKFDQAREVVLLRGGDAGWAGETEVARRMMFADYLCQTDVRVSQRTGVISVGSVGLASIRQRGGTKFSRLSCKTSESPSEHIQI